MGDVFDREFKISSRKELSVLLHENKDQDFKMKLLSWDD